MSAIHLLPVGGVPPAVLEALRTEITAAFGAPCEALAARLDPAFALHAERRQHHSTEILARMKAHVTPRTWRLLGVTEVDLYIPILTFVFGEAQVDGACAVVSTHRLRQEFYGLAADARLLQERLSKEAIHEVGHTLGMTHCEDYRCAMAPSHAVEWIDVKARSFCSSCRGLLKAPPPTAFSL